MEEKAFLCGLNEQGKVNIWPLDVDRFIIGRTSGANLIINSPYISREHAIILSENRGFFLKDCLSRNGTFVNGQKIGEAPYLLCNNDQIVFGGKFSFSFSDPKATLTNSCIGRLEGVWINDENHEVWVDCQKINPPLTPQQFSLLTLLYSSPDRVFSSEEIVSAVWSGENSDGISQDAIKSVIKRLRNRLRENPENKDYLQIIRGQGVKLIKS